MPCPWPSPFRFRLSLCLRLSPRRSPLLKHLTSGGSQRLSNRLPAQHSCELVDAIFTVEPPHASAGPVSLHSFFDLEVGVGAGGDLRQVRDAQHLKRHAQRLELAADYVRDASPDSGVDLVEDQ